MAARRGIERLGFVPHKLIGYERPLFLSVNFAFGSAAPDPYFRLQPELLSPKRLDGLRPPALLGCDVAGRGGQ